MNCTTYRLETECRVQLFPSHALCLVKIDMEIKNLQRFSCLNREVIYFGTEPNVTSQTTWYVHTGIERMSSD